MFPHESPNESNVGRVESWSIHCNETLRALGQINRAWQQARLQWMPIASEDLRKVLEGRDPTYDMFEMLAELTYVAQKQITNLLSKRKQHDRSIGYSDDSCDWTLAAVRILPLDASQRTVKTIGVIIQRVPPVITGRPLMSRGRRVEPLILINDTPVPGGRQEDALEHREAQDLLREASLHPVDDPFQESVFFHRTGKPTTGSGHVIDFKTSAFPLPSDLPREKPVGAQSRSAPKPKVMSESDDDEFISRLDKASSDSAKKKSKSGSTVRFGKDQSYSPQQSRSRSRARSSKYYDNLPSDLSDSDVSRYGVDAKLHYPNENLVNLKARDRFPLREHQRGPSSRNARSTQLHYPESQSTYSTKPDHTSAPRSNPSQSLPEGSDKALSKILDKWTPMGSEVMRLGASDTKTAASSSYTSRKGRSATSAPRYYEQYPNSAGDNKALKDMTHEELREREEKLRSAGGDTSSLAMERARRDAAKVRGAPPDIIYPPPVVDSGKVE